LDIDYASALSIELEINIELTPEIWEEALNSVISGDADMTELIPSDDRKEYFAFSKSIYTFRAIVMTRKEQRDIINVNDLLGHKVAIQAGDYANEYINKNLPGVEIIKTDDVLDSINALLDGKVDAVIGDEPVAIYFIGKLGIEDDVNILNPPLYERDISFGVKKSELELLTILNKGILNLKKKEFVQKIQNKWLGLSSPILNDKISAKLMLLFMTTIIILMIVFVIIILWSYALKSEVRKRTDELFKSRNDLQMTFDALSDFLIVVNEKGYIENVNKSFCNWLDMGRENVMGNHYKQIPLLDYFNLNLKVNFKSETIYKARNYAFYITPFEYDDSRVLIIIEDITDHKISQKQMLQQNKMIAVGQLAAGLAHEIRNPLGLIRNYCYVLKSKILNQDELIEKSINTIEASVLRAGNMVDNLLNFSRVGDDKLQCINLKKAIAAIISFESKLVSDKNINIIIDCADDIKFNTKFQSLSHIMLNLLLNAIYAVPDGGIIKIKCDQDSKYLYIDFIDNGEGIADNNIEHIFNPFFTTKVSGKGTGLGLYIVYNEIQKIDGEINVESHIGSGTTFKLKFLIKESCIND
jgi:polar amino acid transport system substrate-binding protein